MSDFIFSHIDTALGEFSLQRFDVETHSPLMQQWVNQPHASFWGMQGNDLAQVKATQQSLMDEGTEIFLGSHDGQPAFLLETYRPINSELVQHMPIHADDIGMHILISKPDSGQPRSGYTLAVFRCIMRFLFESQNAARVVVEPDARNHKVHTLNRRVGFHHFKKVFLEEANKDSLLAYCKPEQFYTSLALGQPAPEQVHHADSQQDWLCVNRNLVCKALSEFLHERLLLAEQVEKDSYLLKSQSGTGYRFRAERLLLDHWLIDSASIIKNGDQDTALLLLDFIQEFQSELGIDDAMLPTYLEEIASTLNGQLWKQQNPIASSAELVNADFQTIEQAMIEGHPCFIANSGKIGFDSQDFHHYAPESGQPLSLIWLAVHRERAGFYCVDGMNYEDLLNAELDLSLREAFISTLQNQGLKPEDYWFMPAHPWQWHNQLQRLFAGEIAEKKLLLLGDSNDAYTAQQSIRTFFNRSRPDQAYVKCALSILNMGFMRGLSSKYMSVTPAINQWVAQTFAEDAYLCQQPLRILREYAAMGYRHPQYDQGMMQTSPYNKMLAALWRDNPLAEIKENQQAMTMAAMLHVDRDGVALLPEIIKASGLSTDVWLGHYLRVYLQPLLHSYYAHGMVFMPHGENLILILENHIPVAAYIKDIGEEVCLLNWSEAQEAELPEAVKRISVKVPKHVELLSVYTDMFDCFFRFVTAILHQHADFPAESFWAVVAESIHEYQSTQPQLQARFDEHDIFQAEFALSCLNRLQLRNNKQMVDLLDPAAALQFAGNLQNPIAGLQNETQAIARAVNS